MSLRQKGARLPEFILTGEKRVEFEKQRDSMEMDASRQSDIQGAHGTTDIVNG